MKGAETIMEDEIKKINEFINKIEEIKHLSEINQLSKFNFKFINKDEISKIYKEIENFKNIERFSIPIVGKISSGKSTFLNFLLGLDFLEARTNDTTKFVTILRHKNEEFPKAYSVNIKIRDENKNAVNFERKDYLGSNIKEIIEKKNEEFYDFNPDLKNIEKYSNFFLIIEANLRIFDKIIFNKNNVNKNIIDYSKIFEFIDFPGLDNSEKIRDFYLNTLMPLIKKNSKFSIFIFDAENINQEETRKIYDEYLNIFSENENNNEKEKNNSFYILNKIDRNMNAENIFEDYAKTNLNLDINKINFFPVNSLELNLKFNKYKNFNNYIEYIVNEYKEKRKISFIKHLEKKIKNDFNVQIGENEFQNYLNDEKNNKNNIEKAENDKKKIEINKFIEQIYEKMMGKFNRKLTCEDYLFFEKKIEQKMRENKNNEEKNNIVIKIYDAFEKSFNNVIDYFKNKIKECDKYINIYNNDKKEDGNKSKLEKILNEYFNLQINEKNFEKINSLSNYINTIKDIINQLKSENQESQFLNEIIKEIENFEKFLIERKIRIPLIGGYSVGKSSLLNSFLEEKILETSDSKKDESNEINAIIYEREELIQYNNKISDITTNIFLIIRNCEEKYIGIWEANLTNLNDYIYFEKKGNNLCSSKSKLKEKIKELNKIIHNENNVYYIMQYPIKSLLKMKIKKELINKIEFIDYPGLDVGNEFFEESIFKNLIASSDIFLYVNNYDLIKKESNYNILNRLIKRIKLRKISFSLDDFLFILNKCDNVNIDKNKAEKELRKILNQNLNSVWDINFIFKINKINNDNLKIFKFSNNYFFSHLKFREIFKNVLIFLIYLEKNTIENNKDDNNYILSEKHFKQELDDLFYEFKNKENYKKKKQKENEFSQADKESVLKFLNSKNLKNVSCEEILNKFYWMKENLDFHEEYVDQKIFLESLGEKINSLDEKLKKEYLNELNVINKDIFFLFFLLKLKQNQVENINISFKEAKDKIKEKCQSYIEFIDEKFKTKEAGVKKIIEDFITEIETDQIRTGIDEKSKNIKKDIEDKIKVLTELLNTKLNEFNEYIKKLIEFKIKEIVNKINNKEETKLSEDIYKWLFNRWHGGAHGVIFVIELILGIGLSWSTWPFLIGYVATHVVTLIIPIWRDVVKLKQYYIENLNEFKDNLKKDLNDYKIVTKDKFKKLCNDRIKNIDRIEKGINDELKIPKETFERVYNQYQNIIKEFR